MKKRIVLNGLMVLAAVVLLLPVASVSAAMSAPGNESGTPSAEGISVAPDTSQREVGIDTTSVTFEGLWSGSCSVYGDFNGTTTHHTAGTFKMTVDSTSNIQGYCIDVNHSVSAHQSWQANVYAAREEGLCEANWILATYSRFTPPSGLSEAEEGAAIQAAIWHYVAGFQPLWQTNNPNGYWCGQAWNDADRAVYNRALEIIGDADGQCISMPSSLDLTASPTELEVGDSADLAATVRDQMAQPFEGQTVDFATTVGTLDPTSDTTDASGVANSTITHDGEATADITASMSGSSLTAAVDWVSGPDGQRQRILIIKGTSYSDEDSTSVSWVPYDYGDAPDSYSTLRTSGGARHKLVAGGPVLGSLVDAEQPHLLADPTLWPDACACSDDVTDLGDEDGVTFLTSLVPDEDASIQVVGTAGAKLYGWIDFGSSGNASDPNTFDASDRIVNGLVLTGSPQTITFHVPEGTQLVDTWARFRISTASGLGPTGDAPDGEVEDYALRFSPTAVKLLSFEARARQNAIVLKWETASEIDNLGFSVYRAEAAEGTYTKLNKSLIPSQVPPGSPVGATYTFRDRTAQPGIKYFYKLEAVDIYGHSTFHGPVDALMR